MTVAKQQALRAGPGTRMIALTDALGMKTCQHCLNLAASMDTSEANEPGWCAGHADQIIVKVKRNAEFLLLGEPSMARHYRKYFGTISFFVWRAIKGGVPYQALLATLQANPFVRRTVNKDSKPCDGC